MYKDETLLGYLKRTAAREPVPGGGSVSAYVAALGAALGAMTCNFTIGKEKFKDVEPQIQTALNSLNQNWMDLMDLCEEDSRAYNKITEAYGMPKKTPEEKAARSAAIEEASRIAMSVPINAMRISIEAMKTLDDIAEIANPMLISDVMVGAVLLEGAILGLRFNVDINLKNVKDEQLKAATVQEIDRLCNDSANLRQSILKKSSVRM